ncbi:retrovirus-related pol polyprotein from transposon TNT 1-94 [Tanacetum coccineum]
MPKSSLQLVDEFVDEGVPEKKPAHDDEEANLQQALELSLKDQGGKEKVVDEQAAHDLLTLHTPKQKSPADQFIFQRRTPMPTESSRHVESPSLDAELALTDSETKSDEEAPEIYTGDQDEGQARPNPGEQDEGQARPNLVEQDEGHAGSNPGAAAERTLNQTEDQVITKNPGKAPLETLSSLQNLDKELSFTNQFFIEKPQEEELKKTNTESEV